MEDSVMYALRDLQNYLNLGKEEVQKSMEKKEFYQELAKIRAEINNVRSSYPSTRKTLSELVNKVDNDLFNLEMQLESQGTSLGINMNCYLLMGKQRHLRNSTFIVGCYFSRQQAIHAAKLILRQDGNGFEEKRIDKIVAVHPFKGWQDFLFNNNYVFKIINFSGNYRSNNPIKLAASNYWTAPDIDYEERNYVFDNHGRWF